LNRASQPLAAPLLFRNRRGREPARKPGEVLEQVMHLGPEQEVQSREVPQVEISELEERCRVRAYLVDELGGRREVEPDSVSDAPNLGDTIPVEIAHALLVVHSSI
jgi:hypothetical protein